MTKMITPRDYLNKPLVFDMKKTSEEKILDRIIEKLSSDNNQLYVKHRADTDTFIVNQDKRQQEKGDFRTILNLDKKMALPKKSNNKKNITAIKRLKIER